MWPDFYLRRHGDRRDQREVLATPREIRSPDARGGGGEFGSCGELREDSSI